MQFKNRYTCFAVEIHINTALSLTDRTCVEWREETLNQTALEERRSGQRNQAKLMQQNLVVDGNVIVGEC